MDYRKYGAEDFVMDKRFREWVLQNQHQAFWTTFIKENPYQSDVIHQAKQILISLTLDQESLSDAEIEELQLNIHKALNTTSALYPSVNSSNDHKWLKIAAGFSGFLLLSLLYLWWNIESQPIIYSTAYGEIKEIELPDGSLLTLNANSQLKWLSDTSTTDDRVVFLEGEAFFDVKRKAQGQKFIVQTDNVRLEVLGTSFNVKGRREQTQVVLRSGKVALQHKDTGEKTLMEAGDYVSTTNEMSSFSHQKVNPELYTSWTERKLLINNTSLKEIARIIEDSYGYEVIFKSKSIEERKFSVTTTVPLNDLQNLIELIEITFKIDISQTKNQIIMQEQ